MRHPRALPDPATAPRSGAGVVNLANGVTVARLLLVPVFAVLLFTDDGGHRGWRAAAAGVFVVATLTDRVDGELARRRGLVTDFGAIADPIADKTLMGTALVGLSVLDDLPWAVTAVILAREVGVTLLRFWVLRRGVIPASAGGKLKTLLQSVAIALYILPLSGALATGRAWLMGLAVAVTVVTGLDYVARAMRLRRTASP